MPDTLNKQTLINLLIDSPLREPIKINLIDIVNNTAEPDLPKVYSTITKELEIFQKATERRMKLAEETIAKLGGTSTDAPTTPPQSISASTPLPTPVPPVPEPSPVIPTPSSEPSLPPLSVPPLDLPPLPVSPTQSEPPTEQPVAPAEPVAPTPEPLPTLPPLGAAPVGSGSDEDALAEIQKELDSLKTEAAADVANAAAPAAPTTPPVAPTQQ